MEKCFIGMECNLTATSTKISPFRDMNIFTYKKCVLIRKVGLFDYGELLKSVYYLKLNLYLNANNYQLKPSSKQFY